MVSTSVVICAYTENRWADTMSAIGSVRSQVLQPLEIILVIDHNSELYIRMKNALSDVKVVENENTKGLSGGRNTGIQLATGDVIAFLDDDAVADPFWLKYLADSYTDHHVVGVGGMTMPAWDTKRPNWFPREFDWIVGCAYRGMPETRSSVRNLHGGNASFRTEVLMAIGGFATGIGRSGSKRPMGCEETELCLRIRKEVSGADIIFDNRAVVYHRVPTDRCRFSYFRSRCYAEGLSKAQVVASSGMPSGLATERAYSTKVLPAGVMRGLMDAVSGRPSGLGRSGAIIVGFSATSFGFIIGTIARIAQRSR